MPVTIESSVTIDVSDEDIECMIDVAGYGINYWCETAMIDSDKRTYTITPDAEARESGYDQEYELSFDDIVRVTAEIALGQHEISSTLRGYASDWLLDARSGSKYTGGSLDSDIMDCVIQVACFGEVVFG